jgi:3-phosphoshikimate 1-carboxyvinyltransferase
VIEIPTTQSSQFVSGLLLAAPWLRGGLTLKMVGRITSKSYVAMTLGLLHRLGATVKTSEDLRVIRVGPREQQYEQSLGIAPFVYAVEPDASGATYFWAAAALLPGATCLVRGLDSESLQGDAQFPDLLARMGVIVRSTTTPGVSCTGPDRLAPILADMSEMPDAAMTLAVVASFARTDGMGVGAEATSVLRGLRTLRVKETDRIAALQNELAKIGVRVETSVAGDDDVISITPPNGGVDCSPDCPPVAFETYDDHRMAMSLALVGLRRPNVSIKDPGCVAKTYPTFWRDLAKLYP